MNIGDVVINPAGEECTVISLNWGKVTVQYNDEFNCMQIFQPEQLTLKVIND